MSKTLTIAANVADPGRMPFCRRGVFREAEKKAIEYEMV